MRNMHDVVKSLGSDKVKERQEGLAAIREVFSHDQAVENFAIENGTVRHENFMLVFQALFRVVGKEKDTATRATSSKSVSTTAPLRRLSDSANTLRWLIERTVHFMNGKVATTCVKHLIKILHDSDKVFDTIALDYSKALRCILGYTPHLDHLTEESWLNIVGLAFNVILGDPIAKELVGNDDMEVVHEVDSDMYADDTDGGAEPSTSTKGRKRSRREATPEPILSPRKSNKLKQKRNVIVSVSLEQVEFTSVLRLLLSAPNAPLLPMNKDQSESQEGEEEDDDVDVASAVLHRLQRFLEMYPADSSLLRDYIAILSVVLEHLSYNKIIAVQIFARSTWDGLISLWGTKDKAMKEGLLIVLRQLFPFVTCPPISEQKLPELDLAEGIGRLWHLLDSEAENRWGVDGLSLDALRLEITRDESITGKSKGSFVAKTFQAGWNFDAGQALSWAILELQADCAAKLFHISEAIHPTRSEAKRFKMENPVLTLLHSIQTKSANHVRSYHLQVLLFFLDRHWDIIHKSLKEDILDVLLQFVAFEEVSVQSWVFLNFAAIACAEGSKTITEDRPLILTSEKWDTIWTHTVRRVNVPGVCRAACHAGYTLLLASHKASNVTQGLISNRRVLPEIEALLKDMDVQGPSHPFDSVCSFLVQSLTIAGQDVRLYRMHLEAKVISWLVDNWKVVGNRQKMAANTMVDVLHLLEILCSLSKRSVLNSRILLPQTEIVEHVLEENKTKIIREFVIHARLPPFIPPIQPPRNDKGQASIAKDKIQLVGPRGKERKVSAFFLRTLETLATEWEALKDQNPTAEMARCSLDFALTAVVFESLLAFNGISVNRQVLQSAGRVISIITPLLLKQIWVLSEKVLVAQAFEQLLFDVICSEDIGFREALAPPGEYSGIKEQLLHKLTRDHSTDVATEDERLDFLRQMWQNQDIQEIVASVMTSMRTLLRQLVEPSSSQEHAMDVDEKDGFGPIRTTTRQNTAVDMTNTTGPRLMQRLLQTCVSFLACGPYLQSSSGTATRDPELTQLVLKSAEDPNKFKVACPILFRFVQRKIFHASLKTLHRCLRDFGDILRQYPFSKRQSIIIAFLDFLNSILGVWKSDDELAKEVHSDLRQFYSWLSGLVLKGTWRSWVLRDTLTRFFSRYLVEDPTQESWVPESENNRVSYSPASLLPRLHRDHDIRVRFRAAVIDAGLFSISHHFQQTPLDIYETMKKFFPAHLNKYEHMLTRLLALGNIVVVSAPVRRGAYWHMLEACTAESSYSFSSHMETILVGVSRRLGMPSLSILFEAYAFQMALSLHQLRVEFLSLPSHLLGYRDKKHYAEATFQVFTPFNVLTRGVKPFEDHCKLVQKDMVTGLRECFGNVVGLQLATYWHQDPKPPGDIEQILRETFSFLPEFAPPFEDHLDVITTAILKSLGDQNWGSGNESIATALQALDPKIASTFQALVRYRTFDALRTHPPNRPAFTTTVVLQCLRWLSENWTGFSSHTTYHVLHQLLNDLNDTPLVNEQLRLINAMSLWIAYRQEDFAEPTIADCLIHGATFILSQSDLARAAQSILEWAFMKYPPAKNWKESRLPNMVVRIRCISQDYSSEIGNPSLSALGEDLVKWMDAQMISFARKSAYRKLVLRVLPTWPQQPSTALAKLYDEISLHELTSILEDHRITSNKFRLVRRLQERTSLQEHHEEEFSKIYFWRLKECIPSLDRLQEEDVDAFANLLSFYHGQIGSLNIEQPDMLSPRNRHRRHIKKRTAEDTVAARDAITLGLLVMLDDDDPCRVYNAYHTLRLALSVSDQKNDYATLPIPFEYRQDIECLKSYKRSPILRTLPNVAEILTYDKYIECSRNFSEWVSQISILLADALTSEDLVFGQLSSVLASDVDFAEEVLPILIHTILQTERQKSLAEWPIREPLSKYFTTILSSTTTDIRCIRSIVEVVLHLRNILPAKSDALAYNKWLEVDFSLLARSAILCGAYTTALLFVELASEHDRSFKPDDEATEKVLYEIYAHIDEPDGFYGIRTQDLQQLLLKRFHHEKQWDKAFRFHAAALEADGSQNGEQMGLLQSLHSFGFDHLAIETLRCFRENGGSLPTSLMNYKLGWRTETWDLPDDKADTMGTALYRSLRAIYRERDMQMLNHTIRTALYEEMEHLRSLGSENLAEIRVVSQDLMCLSEILQWRRQYAGKLQQPDSFDLADWQPFIHLDAEFDFPDLEAIMATRIALVRSVRQREERYRLGNIISPFLRGLLDIEQKCLLRLSQAARSSDQVQIALNSVIRAQKLDGRHMTEVNEEFANVLWLQKEETPAVQFLQNILKTLNMTENGDELSHHALLSSRLGSWTSEACLEKPTDIWDKYFLPSVASLESIQQNEPHIESIKATVYRECAMFAERQFHAVLKSPDALRWKLYVDRKKNEIETRNKEITRTQDASVKQQLKTEQGRALKLLHTDSELFKKHNELRETFLTQAIEMHSRCLETSNEFDDDSTIRLCSLWFANFEDASILHAVSSALDRIPSRKLVFLAHQITARVSNPLIGNLPENQEILQRLVVRMCQEHPFHSLYQIYCISDQQLSDDRRHSGRLSQSTQTERGTAANTILDRLRNDEQSGKRVIDIIRICDACLEWAKYPIRHDQRYKKKGKCSFEIPQRMKILAVNASNLKVPVLTARTPLDPTLKYDNCVWIDHFSRTFETAGGNNLPKINVCHGSNGEQYKQLFKGEGSDDLRQDAVMEQVFDLVNNLLRRDRETKRRDLCIRGYMVIPLSNQAGLLEFVGNTSPLRDWLHRAHLKYNPNDHKPDDVYTKIRHVQESYKNHPEKHLETFLNLQKRFHPVLRHYFTELHKTSIPWFTMRLTYTRSVATTSIVGHVLGLGDRHASNILLDNKTGDVVHIDLGIAFDQGKLLPVPECVPFRMTADIVDGMGISGTAGVFQRCAEETLRVLRDESGVIMTVLEVFKHDPLHSWTASEIKVKQAQAASDVPPTPTVVSPNDTGRFNIGIGLDMTSGSADEAADRALSSVARKLDKSLSVQSTVNELIAEATDPMNLATIYFGWCAWM